MTSRSAQSAAIPGHTDRDSLIAACNRADSKLHEISGAFDFLLCVSPTNTLAAMREFFAGRCRHPPHFKYRQLQIDPDELRRKLHAIEFGKLHEPLIEGLLLEKSHELDRQIDLVAARNTPAFATESEKLYGSVSDELLATAKYLLSIAKPHMGGARKIGAEELQRRAKQLVRLYQLQDARFDPVIELRSDVSGLVVSYPRLLIDLSSRVSERRVDPLLCHEVSVHLLTGFNGAAQGLSIFSTGLAGYEEIQEGLGVFAEWAVGGLTQPRLRLIAGRVVAVRAMVDGADFVECYRILHHDCGIRPQRAFGICARVYRSGGFAKDAIYLRGFLRVMEWLADGGDLDHFWRAKIALIHVPLMDQLAKLGLIQQAQLHPEFLERDDTIARIARYRSEPSADLLLDSGTRGRN